MAARNSLLLTLLVVGCAGPNPTHEFVAEESLAVNACDEMVPPERSVDGLPAYAQCDLVESGNIWSNNGVDTSTTSLGDDWIQTQRGGGYQCTEWAFRYMYFRFGISYRHGNAEEWCDGDLPSSLAKTSTPAHGDLIVFEGGVCGAAESTGHIAVVDTIDTAGGKVTFVEQNRAGRRTANQTCATCFLHAVANDGSSGGFAGMVGAAGATGGGPSIAGAGGHSAGGTANASGGDSSSSNGGMPASLGGRSGEAGGFGASAGSPGMAASGGIPAAIGGAGGTGATAGSAGGVVAGDPGGGGAGAPPAPMAGGPSAGTNSAGTGPLSPSTADSYEVTPEVGCSYAARRTQSPSGALLALVALLAFSRSRRRGRDSNPWYGCPHT